MSMVSHGRGLTMVVSYQYGLSVGWFYQSGPMSAWSHGGGLTMVVCHQYGLTWVVSHWMVSHWGGLT